MGQAMSELGDPNELDEDSQEGQEEGGAQSPGRSDGNGRYNLRPRSTSPPDGAAGGASASSPPRRDLAGLPRPASSILQNQALRSVLQLLADMDGSEVMDEESGDDDEETDEEQAEDDETTGSFSRRRNFQRLLLYSPDTAGSSFDEGETAASVGALDVISSLRRGGRGGGWSRRRGGEHPLRKHVKPSPELLKTLNASDFSWETRQWLGMSQPVMQKVDQELECAGNNKLKTGSAGSSCSESASSPPPHQETLAPASIQSENVSIPCQRTAALIPSALTQRELGGRGRNRAASGRVVGSSAALAPGSGFSLGYKAQLLSNYLPNHHQRIETFSHQVFNGIYSTCGDMFVSACQDHNIRLFDTANGKFKQFRRVVCQNVGWSVLDVGLSPDKRHLVYSSWCDDLHQVKLHDDSGRLVSNSSGDAEGGAGGEVHVPLPLQPATPRFAVFSLRFSHDGDEILCGCNHGYIQLFDRGAATRSLSIEGHEDDVNAVSFVDSATHVLASGGDDGLCKIWDRRSLRESRPRPVGTLAGHADGITYIDPKGDGRHLITNSKDQSVKLWDIRQFSSQDAIERSRDIVSSAEWDYRWQTAPKRVQRRTVPGDSSIMTYRGHSVQKTLIRAKFSPIHTTGQRFIYTGSSCGSVYIYDTLTGDVENVLYGHSKCVRDLSWHPYLTEIVTSSWDNSICRWTYVEQIAPDVKPPRKKSKSSTGSEGEAEASGSQPRRSKRNRTAHSPT